MCNENTSLTVTNCTFSRNTADYEGGGMYNFAVSFPKLTNCILWGNSDNGGPDESAQIHNVDSIPAVNYCCVQGWAGHLAAKALREKDYGLAWKIQRDLISDLQSLGYLPRSPEQYHVQIGTFVDLVQLAMKKVDAEVIEPGADSKNALPGPWAGAADDDAVL